MLSPDSAETLVLTRTFNAPRERVFNAWTDARALERWFQPMGMRIKVIELDVQVGGRYQFDMVTSERNSDTISGEYLEVVRPERLVFTWRSPATNDKDTIVTIDLTERNGKTIMSFTHTGFTDRDMLTNHETGWLSVLDRIAGVIRAT